jgi:hypothetical protein
MVQIYVSRPQRGAIGEAERTAEATDAVTSEQVAQAESGAAADMDEGVAGCAPRD